MRLPRLPQWLVWVLVLFSLLPVGRLVADGGRRPHGEWEWTETPRQEAMRNREQLWRIMRDRVARNKFRGEEGEFMTRMRADFWDDEENKQAWLKFWREGKQFLGDGRFIDYLAWKQKALSLGFR